MAGFIQGLQRGFRQLDQVDPAAVAADDAMLNQVAAETINTTDDDPDVDIVWVALLDKLA